MRGNTGTQSVPKEARDRAARTLSHVREISCSVSRRVTRVTRLRPCAFTRAYITNRNIFDKKNRNELRCQRSQSIKAENTAQ